MLQNVSCFTCHFLRTIWAGEQRNIVRFPAGARGTGICSSEVKWPGLETDPSSTSCAEVKNERSYAYTPTVFCHGVHSGDLNFT